MVHVCVCVLVLVLHGCAVTVSSTGAENQFQGDDNDESAHHAGTREEP